MNSINLLERLTDLSFNFSHPLFLLVFIPAIALSLYPYLRLPPKRRRNRNRIVSMVLHLIIMTSMIMVLSGFSIHTKSISIKNDVIILVDASDSNKDSKDEMNKFIRDIMDESNSEYNIGIITFGNGNLYNSKLSKNTDKVYNDYINDSSKPDGSATNIASALIYARDQLSKPIDGRIILLSDGLETDGNAIAAAKSISNLGTRIDAVFFSSVNNNDEAKIFSIELPEKIGLNQGVKIDVKVQSNKISNASVSLYDNGVLCEKKSVKLSGGTDLISFSYSFSSSKLHELKAVLECDKDTVHNNNTFYSFVNIEVMNKILIVDGNGNESAKLAQFLQKDYQADVVNLSNLPSTLNELKGYDEVILMNVKNFDLSKNGFINILSTYVKDYGGGLFTVGGDKAYDESDLKGSILEDMMPIESSDALKPLSLIIVIDSSSSMNQVVSGTGGKTRLDLAQEGAIACIDTLKSSDFMGVITFNSTAKEVIGLTPVTKKDELMFAIEGITTVVGTQYVEAIELAGDTLKGSNYTDLKHIIFITDGEPQDEGYVQAVNRLGEEITFSTIAIGDGNNINSDVLEEMAELGGGHYYYSENGNDLTEIILEDTEVSDSKRINAIPFEPILNTLSSPALYGINKLPDFGGYYGGVKAKTRATVVISTNGDPIYANWYYGLGRVGSLMCDLNGTWSSKYFSESVGQMFLNNVIRSLFPLISSNAYDIKVTLNNDNYMTQIKVNTPSNNNSVKAVITDANGSKQTLKLIQQSSSTFSGMFTTDVSGVYTIEVQKSDREGKVISETTTFYAFSYSKEYEMFENESVCFSYLKDLTVSGGGIIFDKAQGMFEQKAQIIEDDINPSLILLIVAIILFLVDIASRKFKFKWPHEIIRALKEKSAL